MLGKKNYLTHFLVSTECTGAQRGAEVETVSKLKALLVRTKKELAEGRRKEVELGEHVDKLTAELESGRGQFEDHKVVLENICV